MNSMKIFYIILIFVLILILSSCELKYGLTDYLLDTNNGSWKQIGDVQGTDNTMGISSIFIANDIPYLAYINNTNDLSPDDDVVIVKRYYNDLWQTLNGFPTDPVFTGSAMPLSMTYMNNLHVSYVNSTAVAKAMNYNLGSWIENDIIPNTFNAEIASMNNKIYGAYQDTSFNIGAYDNGSTTILSPGYLPSITTFALPVIAFKNGATIDIRGYDESSDTWTIPISNITGGSPIKISLRGYANNLAVAYEDSGSIYVKKFNSTLNTWEDVGGTGHTFRDIQIYYNKSLAVDNDYVYLAYTDTLRSDKATVMRCKYDGNWEVVGEKGFTAHRAYNIMIKINNGIPYISYHKNSTNGKIVVMKYD